MEILSFKKGTVYEVMYNSSNVCSHSNNRAFIEEALIESSKQARVIKTWLFCYGSFIIAELILLL